MATPEELQQDKDFVAASPADQAAYLSDTDPDFKRASPADQTRYLAHVTGKGAMGAVPRPQPDMQTSALGHLAPREVPRTNGAEASQADMPGFEGMMASGDEGKAASMTSAGLGAAASLGIARVIPMLGGIAAKHPIITQTILSSAINEGRKIPYVGKFIPPYAEMLPFLLGGAKGGAAAEAEAGGAAALEKGAAATSATEATSATGAKTAPIYRDATLNRRNIPEYAGEEALPWNSVKNTVEPPAKAVSNQPIGQPSASEPFSQRQVTPSTQNIRENEALARQAEQTRPTKTYGSRDSIEDRGINQEFAQDLEKQGIQADEEAKREFAARNTSYTSKADMAKNVKVKTVKTPSAAPSDDLTPILQKMLDNARKGKPIK